MILHLTKSIYLLGSYFKAVNRETIQNTPCSPITKKYSRHIENKMLVNKLSSSNVGKNNYSSNYPCMKPYLQDESQILIRLSQQGYRPK